MNPLILVIGGLTGFIVYDKVVAARQINTGTSTPAQKQLPDWASIFNIGGQPTTANGQNNGGETVVNTIGNVLNSSLQFGSQLLSYIGAQDDKGDAQSGYDNMTEEW